MKFICIDFLLFSGHNEFSIHLIVNLQQLDNKIVNNRIYQNLEVKMIKS